MEQFTEALVAFRDRMEAALPAAFRERERGVMIAGRGCALAAGYSLSGEKKMFGVVGTGSFTHSHELRLLYSAPGLTAEGLLDWGAYAKQVLEARIQLDRAHEFSIFSMILAVDGVDGAVKRGKRTRRSNIRRPARAGRKSGSCWWTLAPDGCTRRRWVSPWWI